jgi:stearoyl-CoA desaturase (delta-9 desaturase)
MIRKTVFADLNSGGDHVPADRALTQLSRPKIEVSFLLILIAIHFFALIAFLPSIFVWWGIPLVFVGSFIFGSLGINLGFHRMLTHRSVVFPRLLERLWVLCGVCSLEGSPLWWACVHRIHHHHSDEIGDPHSPSKSLFWGHMQWLYTVNSRQYTLATYVKYVPDLVNDPFLCWLHRRNTWALVYVAHAILLAVIGFAIGLLVSATFTEAEFFGLRFFVWGVLVRTVYVWHVTWLVNSLAHRWGYRNFETIDKSYNNVLVAVLTNGEGWHNNHHAAPRACSQRYRWWEIDFIFIFVLMLQLFGLAWNVVPTQTKGHFASFNEKLDSADL